MQIQDITNHKKAENALKESAERYRGVVQNTTAVILRINPQGIIQFANKRALEFFGYSADELIGKHAVGTIVPEHDTAGLDLAAMINKIAKNPDCFHSNANENIRKNGERVWMEWTNSGIYDKDGNLKEFLSVGIDATKHKNAEEALKESEEKFSKAFYSNSAGMVIATLDGEIIEVNDAYAKITGYKREELLGQKSTDLNILSAEAREEIVKRLFNGDSIFNEEFEIRAKTGEKRQILYTSEFIEFGGEKRGFTIVYDITERKNAEEQLKESESRFRSLYENSYDAILLTKPDGSILAANPAAQKMFDMTEEEITSAGREGIVVKDESWGSVLKERRQKGRVKAEFTFKRKDGSTFLGETTSSLFTDADGTIKTSMIIRDTTKRRQLEEELRKSRDNLELKVEERTAELDILIDELKRSNAELQQFAYVSSHDLQEPLRTIASFTQLLEKRYKGKFDSDADEFMDYIVEAAKRMQQLINDLLEYSQSCNKRRRITASRYGGSS